MQYMELCQRVTYNSQIIQIDYKQCGDLFGTRSGRTGLSYPPKGGCQARLLFLTGVIKLVVWYSKAQCNQLKDNTMPESTILLPQSPESILHSITDRLRVLALKKALVDIAISALENFFISCNLREFDAHVGETLCQIRAYHVYLLRLKPEYHYNHSGLTKKLIILKQLSCKLQELIHHFQYNNFRRMENQLLGDFLQEHGVVCNLSEQEIYLIQLHVLSNFKMFDAVGDVAINYKKMCSMFGVSKHTARRIVHIYQLSVSRHSTDFIYSLVANDSSESIFMKLFDDFKKVDEEGRFTLPCYRVMSILYKDMLRRKCSILIVCKRLCKQEHIDTAVLLFKPSNLLDSKYEYCETGGINQNHFGFVIEGIVNYNDFDFVPSKMQYIKLFIERGVKNVLFANMAIHPQYAGKKLSLYKDAPYLDIMREIMGKSISADDRVMILKEIHCRQQEMKNYALRYGCGKLNPSFFYIRHIFCDTVANQLELNKLYESESFDESLTVERAVDSYRVDSYIPLRKDQFNPLRVDNA